jgi:hypothetical protein
MSQTPSDLEQEKHLDAYYPFIEQNQEPPGRWIPAGDGLESNWQGKLGWRTRHGAAVVIWSLGRPKQVIAALYPDGSRGEARDTLDHGFRRRSTGDKLWIYGKIDIRPDDVLFVDGEQPPVYIPPAQTEVPDLEADLARDAAFLAAIQDDRFAAAAYTIFRNRDFLKVSNNGRWGCGERQAAVLVANLRGRGECYHDYFLGEGLEGTYPDDRPDIARKLRSEIARLTELLASPSGERASRRRGWSRHGVGWN